MSIRRERDVMMAIANGIDMGPEKRLTSDIFSALPSVTALPVAASVCRIM